MLKLQDIVSEENLIRASRSLKRRSSPGVDNISPKEFLAQITETDLAIEIIESLKNGTYKPGLLKLIQIPKPNGTTRDIFVPIVMDRAIQKMLAEGLNPEVENIFLETSYGFRPNRSVHMAVTEATRLIREGYTYCFMIDLKNFFGSMDQEWLRKLLRDYQFSPDLRKLINTFFTAKTQNIRNTGNKGVPAGIPIAPLLANIYLHPLDLALHRRDVKFVRYADDITIFFRNEEEYLNFRTNFWDSCEQRFKIIVNHHKTNVYPGENKPLLGFDLDNYGGILVSRSKIDGFRESLFGFLADPELLCAEKIERTRSRILSFLSFYKTAHNYDWVFKQIVSMKDEISSKISCEAPIDLIPSHNTKIAKIDDILLSDDFYLFSDLI